MSLFHSRLLLAIRAKVLVTINLQYSNSFITTKKNKIALYYYFLLNYN